LLQLSINNTIEIWDKSIDEPKQLNLGLTIIFALAIGKSVSKQVEERFKQGAVTIIELLWL
jgi:hypothetical protein